MIYLNQEHLEQLGIAWNEIFDALKDGVYALKEEDFSQPVKPYLRYRNPLNRIIAMPAFLGGETNMAGLKWIASFPENIGNGIPRAHSVTILNEAETGKPLSIINTAYASVIRTTGVTGLFIDEYIRKKNLSADGKLKVGMTGFGPIGRMHAQMIHEVFGDYIESIKVYDLKFDQGEKPDAAYSEYLTVCNSWEEAFDEADIFVTCTVSKAPYIDRKPKKGSLHLNVSLRDYKPSFREHVDLMIVDDWEEICRENTDVENMHKEGLLNEEDTHNIAAYITSNNLNTIPADHTVMFNPMGMAIFDIATGGQLYRKARENKVGVELT
jgi:ornithine cyclodeaminase